MIMIKNYYYCFMKDIDKYINESFDDELIIEGDLDFIIRDNLKSLTEEEVIENVRYFSSEDLKGADISKVYTALKNKMGSKPQLWAVPNTPEYDDYDRNCQAWAHKTYDKYLKGMRSIKEPVVIEILTRIAWVINSMS